MTLTIPDIADQLATLQPREVPLDVAPRRAAVAIVLSTQRSSGELEVLYIRRVEHPQDPWSGQMAFPGGHVEDDDGGAGGAAVRETREEVGLDLAADGRLLGRLDDFRAVARGRLLPMAITPYVFELQRPIEPVPDPDEVADVVWLPLARLADDSFASTLDYDRGGRSVALPCWQVNGYTIWGLTYLMTREFLRVLGHGDGAAIDPYIRLRPREAR